MKSRTLNTVFALSLLALLVAGPALAESERGRIRPGDEIAFTFIADTDQQAQITSMWDRFATDLDIYVFLLPEDDDSLLVAASTGATEVLESVEIGVIGGEQYLVLLSHFDGAGTRYQLNISTSGSELISKGGGVASLGTLSALAAKGDDFAAMEQVTEQVRELKRRAR